MDSEGEPLHSDRPSTIPGGRTAARRALTGGAAILAALLVTACSSGASKPAAQTSSGAAVDLKGVTIHFADQLKQYQTILEANDSLAGAPYTVDWSEFTAGPPIVAAETGGSVDVGAMAETPTVFAQAAGDPIEVVAVSEGTPSSTPFAIVVRPSSPVHRIAELRGRTVAVQEGTTEQYLLVRALQQAGVPYSAVRTDNINIVAGEAALEAGQVDAYVTSEPLTSLMVQAGKARVLTGATGVSRYMQYITASRSALRDRRKRAAITDLVTRIFQAESHDARDPSVGVQTYVKTYGVPLAVARRAAASVILRPSAVTASIIRYQQQEEDTFRQLGLIPRPLVAADLFDLPLARQITSAWDARQGGSS